MACSRIARHAPLLAKHPAEELLRFALGLTLRERSKPLDFSAGTFTLTRR
jgi:hypothetical protein